MLFDFDPDSEHEVQVGEGETIHILARSDPNGNPEWWYEVRSFIEWDFNL